MTETRNLGLKKYEATDRYDLMASYNDSMDIIDAAFGVNGIFVYTESEYAALENKDDLTLYIVIPDEEVSS